MLGRLLKELTAGANSLASVARPGILRPERPDKLARMAPELQRRGPLAAVTGGTTASYPGFIGRPGADLNGAPRTARGGRTFLTHQETARETP